MHARRSVPVVTATPLHPFYIASQGLSLSGSIAAFTSVL